MNLEDYFDGTAEAITFTREKASLFAKSVAGDFNPIHNPDARRFCVPGDLLFAVFLHQHGISEKMHFDFQNMVGDSITLQQQVKDDGVVMQDAAGREYLTVKTQGNENHQSSAVESLSRAYVQFSGQTFPYLLVELMKEHRVMINPKRPLVIYKSMELMLNDLDTEQASLRFSGATLEGDGKKAEVSLNFDICRAEKSIGSGNKKMVLGGLQDYDQPVMDNLVSEYNGIKDDFQRTRSS